MVFRGKGWNKEQYLAWSDKLAKSGVMLLIPTSHEGETVLRMAFTNPDTDIDKVLKILLHTTK